MTYKETIEYLYSSVPVFQISGGAAYKPGLERSIALDDYLCNPHTAYKTIHVAGTNGKGSVCHILAAILQKQGYKVGLYTSPHLVDFRERIRVNGEMVSEEYVVEFVENNKKFFESVQPSFFELTSSMAFAYFRYCNVDIAIIETGLGGRLDSTNIITPILSVITNVSPDHQQYLGDTLEEIATEKAGIMKPEVPVVIGYVKDEAIATIFNDRAELLDIPLYFSQYQDVLGESYLMKSGEWYLNSKDYGQLFGQLFGAAQGINAHTVLTVLRLLHNMDMDISKSAVRYGFEHVVELTGLRGRWEVLQEKPRTICDTGHNEGAWEFLTRHLEAEMKHRDRLHMIIGMVNDKDVKKILSLMPADAYYYFTQPSIDRALPVEMLVAHALSLGLSGVVCDTVSDAVSKAMEQAGEKDLVFIGGSTFVVADALPMFDDNTSKKH